MQSYTWRRPRVRVLRGHIEPGLSPGFYHFIHRPPVGGGNGMVKYLQSRP